MLRVGALCLVLISLLVAGCGSQTSSVSGEAQINHEETKQYESHGWGKEEAEGAAKAGRDVEAEEATNAAEADLHQREREDLPAVEAEEAQNEGH